MKRLLVAILLTTCCLGSIAQEQYSTATGHARDSVTTLMKKRMIPGLAITVSVRGQVVWSEGFGYADLEQNVRVDPAATRFRIGSISKSLTAAALGKLLERQQIIPDSSIYFYLPDYPPYRYRPTVRQVAGHIAGIRHYRGDEFHISRRYATVEEGLTIFRNDSLLFEPGTKYQYSSYGYNLLSAVLEKASRKEFLLLMAAEVFSPLGMTNTSPDFNDSIVSNRTRFYEVSKGRWVNAPYVDNSYKWAGGGFVSTSEDICKFGNALLGDGFLQRTTIQELTQSQTLKDGSLTGYGMGLTSAAANGLKFFGHSGGSVGGTSHMVIYPDEGIVVVILTNLSDARLGQMAHHIARLYMK